MPDFKKAAASLGMMPELTEEHEALARKLSEEVNGPFPEDQEPDDTLEEDDEPGTDVVVAPEMGVDTTHEDNRLREAEDDIDHVIKVGKGAMDEAFDSIGLLDPSRRHLANQAAADVMKATIDAIKHKTDTAHKGRDHKLEMAKSLSPTGEITSSVTNIFTDRETLLAAIEREEAEDDDPDEEN